MTLVIPPRLQKFWDALKPWVVCRLSQPSTYLGLLLKVAALFGYVMSDSMAGHIAEAVAAVAGAGLVAYNQKGD